MSRPGKFPGNTVKVRITPLTEIRGMRKADKRLVEHYIRCGFVKKDDVELFRHVDLVFPRTVTENGPRAYITKYHLMAALKKAADELGIHRKNIDFNVIDAHGNRVDYIVIEPDLPLLAARKVNKGLEIYEYIDPGYYMEFLCEATDVKAFLEALFWAGKNIGLFSRKKWGYGRFRADIVETEQSG